MLLKKHIKEKLDRIIDSANTRADAEIVKGESMMGNNESSFAAIGFAVGVRFVRDMILAEFLYSDDEDEGDEDGTDI